MKTEKLLLWGGIVSWIIYIPTVLVLAAITPGYSHVADIISMMGRHEAPYHQILNSVTILYGFLILTSGLGFFYSVKRLTGRNKLAMTIGILVGLFGISSIFVGLFPMPNPRHNAYGIGNLQVVIPFFLALAFWESEETRPFAFFHIVSFIIILLVFVSSAIVIAGSPGNIPSNMGLLQRIIILSIFFWYISTYYWFLTRKQPVNAINR